MLAEIGGFAAVSLQPAAGAHGELTGILILRRRLADLGQAHRTRILVPDSAHGTNPASTAMAGFEAVEIPSDARGNVDLAKLKAALDETDRGPDADQPQHARPVRGAPRGGDVARARGRRPGVRRRGELQRHPRRLPARRAGHRRHALQPAQDLLHPARRRRSRVGRGRRGEGARAVPARARRGAQAGRRPGVPTGPSRRSRSAG